MLDPVRNFALVMVNTGYDSGATTIALASGEGSKLPDPATDGAFNLVWWDSTAYTNPSLDPFHEIVRCTARSGDTLTVTRPISGNAYNGEGSANVAQNHNTSGRAYMMMLCPTRKYMEDIQASLNAKYPLITVGQTDCTYITDGVDDHVEINAAITLANSIGGARVHCPDLVYDVPSRIIPTSNVWLTGAGMFFTRFHATADLTRGIIDNKDEYDSGSPWIGGILSDFELDGSDMDQTRELKGLNADSLVNCKIARIYAHDTTATGLGADDYYGTTLTECIVTGCGYMNKKTITAASWSTNQIVFTSAAHGYSVNDVIIVTGMVPFTYNGRYVISAVTTDTFTVTSTLLDLDPGTATTFGISSDSLIGHNGIGIATGAMSAEANLVTNNICIGNQNNNFLFEADTTGTGPNAVYIMSGNISVQAGQCGFLNTGTPNVLWENNYDYGSIISFQAANTIQVRTITAASWSAGVATFTTSTAHSYSVGTQVDIVGMTPTGYNGYFYVESVPSSTTFTVNIASNPGTATAYGTSTRVPHNSDDFKANNNLSVNSVLYAYRIVNRCDKFSLRGNTAKYGFNYGFYIVCASNGSLSDNHSYGNGRTGFSLLTTNGTQAPMKNVSLMGNHAYNNGQRATYDGFDIQANSTTGGPIDGLSLIANQAYDNQDVKTQRYGMIIRSGGTILNTLVTLNMLVGNATAGMLLQYTGDGVTVKNNPGVNPECKKTLGNISGSVTLDPTTANYFTGTLTGNITLTIPSGIVPGQRLTFVFTQDGTGGRTTTTPSNVKPANGGSILLSPDASVTDTYELLWDGTNWRESGRAIYDGKATGSDIDTGTDDTKFTTSKAIRDSGVISGAVSGEIAALTSKTTPADADVVLAESSADSNAKRKFTWANIKATLKTYFDTLYQPLSSVLTATTASYTTAEQTKLAGIETGAQVVTDVHVGAVNAAAATKNPPIDADSFPIVDSAASSVIKRLTFTNLKAFLKTYFDTVYVYSGSSAPSSPATGQLWYNTTLRQLFYYDSGVDSGSWLSVEVFRANFFNANATTTNQVSWTDIQFQNAADFDIYIEDMVGALRIATTNDGSNYWTAALSRRSANNTDTSIATFTTSADSVNTWTPHKQSIGTFLDVSATDVKAFLLTTSKTASPGSLSGSFGFNYRVVIPK